MNILIFVAYLATIPAANWLIGNVGTVCIPAGPCLVPVLPGMMAPSGVLMIGLALVLRDAVQERMGIKWALGAIASGLAISTLFAPPALVLASAVAYGASELADLAVYTPLRRKGLVLAVLASGMAGAIVDSVLFLALAFGSLEFVEGQIVGKLWMTLLAAAAISAVRRKSPARL